MKSVKKIFFAFFALLLGILLINGKANVEASEPVATPWFITFSNGTVVNVREGDMGFTVLADSFTISYFDATGATTGGYFDLWGESRYIEQVVAYAFQQYLANGASMSFNCGGRLGFKYYQDLNEYGFPTNPVSYQLLVHRSIFTSGRIATNIEEGKEYYNDSIYFDDADDLWNNLNTVIWEVENYTTGETKREYTYFIIYDEGDYCVTAYDTIREETLTYYFTIDKTAAIINLKEVDWMNESPLSDNHITTKGVKVVCSDDSGIESIVYRYKRFTTNYVEEGEIENNFTFYRKGEYQIVVTDIAGNTTTVNFIINNFGITPDPIGVSPVGTEVTQNDGEREGTTLSVGYTRCLYLDGDAPSQSRLDYTFMVNPTT